MRSRSRSSEAIVRFLLLALVAHFIPAATEGLIERKLQHFRALLYGLGHVQDQQTVVTRVFTGEQNPRMAIRSLALNAAR